MPKQPPKKFRKMESNPLQQSKFNISNTLGKNHTQAIKYTQTYKTPMQKIILDTLKYRQIFGCFMTLHQIWNYLLIDATKSKLLNFEVKDITPQQFNDALIDLVANSKVINTNGLYSLKKFDITKMIKRKKQTEKLLVRANQITGYLKQIPWIKMVAVTGSVAAFNADEQSDIDILVVTKPKRLFLSRLFLVLTLKFLGVYWNAKNPAGKICPNIMMSTDNLTWHPKNQNLYTANEVSLIYPLFFRHNCYFEFLKQNDWINKYLPNIDIPEVKPRIVRPTIVGKLLDLAELTSMKIQTHYMKNKITTEIVSKNLIHFNTHDSGPSILKKFKDLDN